MKIGFIGNWNNYPFLIAREVKKLGHEICFIVVDPIDFRLNRPEFFDNEIHYPYPKWIIEIPLKKINYYLRLYFPRLGYRKYLKILNGCDAIVSNGFAHEVMAYKRKNIPHFNLFSGSDLDVLADLDHKDHDRMISNPYLKWLQGIKNYFLRRRKNKYRRGITDSIGLSYFPRGINKRGDKLLTELKSGEYLRYERWCTTNKNESHPFPSNNTIILFSAVRFLWVEPLPQGYNIEENKRNDIMLRGISLFANKNQTPFTLHLVEKGNHIKETKELIQQLGLVDKIHWHKEMSQIQVNEWYKKADIVFEQFGNHIMGAAGLDPMLIGRPVIANGRPEIIEPLAGENLPICQAESPEKICEWLEKLAINKDLRKKIGINSRNFLLRNNGKVKEAEFVCESFNKVLRA